MNGNTPYAGALSAPGAGQRAQEDIPDLTPDQKRQLRDDVSDIVTSTREYLPSEFAVDSDISQGASGLQATIAVQPPVGHPVSAGFAPSPEDIVEGPIVEEDDRVEVARGLAASAVLQVRQALGGDITPAAQ